jgi:tRNA-2-methylthio-N6-dimethylallyladenosine synthase
MAKKLFIRTFGCQMNEYDSDKMADVLAASEEIVKTDTPDDADIILFNTCSVREKAQERVFHDLGRVRLLKRANPDLIIGVGGCVASQEGAAIVARAPYVDVVFGPQTLHRLPQLIAEAASPGQVAGRHFLPRDREIRQAAAGERRGRGRFRLDHGRLQQVLFVLHRALHPWRGSLATLRRRVDRGRWSGRAGRKEVTLLGQNVNAYRGAMSGKGQAQPGEESADLALLIEYIAEIPGIERIRYTTSHPREVTQRLIDVYASVPKLVSHLHLPVQSGSDRVLAAMKRGYTALEYKSLVRKLRAARPDLSLSSDFIVGFPGETADDFEKTMKLIDDLGFDASFSFIYSARPGTPAAELADETPPAVKLERLQRLQKRIDELAQAVSRRWSAASSGCSSKAFRERTTSELAGRTDNNRVVNFAASRATRRLAQSLRRRAHQLAQCRIRCAANSSATPHERRRKPAGQEPGHRVAAVAGQ